MVRSLRVQFLAARAMAHGKSFAQAASWESGESTFPGTAENDLTAHFDRNFEGPGIWKWRHYFEVYDAHLARFRGKSQSLVEIGIYSGGSLPMWQSYLGGGAKITGIDIEENCRSYATGGIEVFIGDQADRGFWRDFRSKVPKVDIIIDDGGHEPHQQLVTLEEMLPHLAPGGVYICEDVHGSSHAFADAVYGMASTLNDRTGMTEDFSNPERRLARATNPFQKVIKSISLYPFLVVIEKRDSPLDELVAPKHGTSWEPFLT